MHNNRLYEWILPTTFTIAARAKSFQNIKPYLSSLVRTDDKVLDLCCGSGPMSFWLEESGAKVTGIDFASYMIELAREEAARRNSTVEFIEADIFKHELEQEYYDLISCFGNSISDFPLSDFTKLVTLVFNALKPGGRFVLEYHDGSYKYMQGNVEREGVYQENPERITFRFKEYLPEIGASVKIIRNETRGEEYERKGYIYTVPVLQLAVCSALSLEQHIVLGADHFLDVFVRQADGMNGLDFLRAIHFRR